MRKRISFLGESLTELQNRIEIKRIEMIRTIQSFLNGRFLPCSKTEEKSKQFSNGKKKFNMDPRKVGSRRSEAARRCCIFQND